MNFRILSLSTLALAALTLNACSSSEKNISSTKKSAETQVTQSAPEQKKTANQVFNEFALNQIHHINQKEIEMGKLADKKATSIQLKDDSRMIVEDHKALEEQLQSVANAQNIKLSGFTPSTHEKNVMRNLETLEGSEFDRAFITQMAMTHQAELMELKQTRKQISDVQISSILDRALPRIQQHAKMSRQLVDTQGVMVPSMAE